jgi:hypothetical protein
VNNANNRYTILQMTNCTVANNTGGGLRSIGSSAWTVLLTNNVLRSGQSGSATLTGEPDTISSYGFNLSSDGGGGFLRRPSDRINTDPQLDPAGLTNHGGPTMTIALLSGSPAVNSGSDELAPTRDQRSYARSGVSDRGAFEFNGLPAEPALASVVSRKVHGASGTFSINLPFVAPFGVECRTSGAAGNHQLVATFAKPVTVGAVTVTSSDGMATATQTSSGAAVTIDLTNVANAQTLTIMLSNVSDGTNVRDVAIPFRVLVGDTTNNGSVTASDIGQVKGQSGQPVSGANFRSDVNVSGGSISASDISFVKSRAGTSLPP